jgi:hypothetical protein
MTVQDNLELLASEFLDGNLNTKFIGVDFVGSSSIDPVAPISGNIKPVKNENTKEDSVVTTQLLSYGVASRAAKDKNVFYYHMSLAVNQALRTLVNTVGNLGMRTVRIQKDGDKFFKDSENCAAFQISFIVE